MLTDIIPAKARRYVYALLALAALGVTCWQAADHDWIVAAGAFVVAVSHSVAASNTSTDKPVVDSTTLAEIVNEVRAAKAALMSHVDLATSDQTKVLTDAVNATVPPPVEQKVTVTVPTATKPAAKKAAAKRAAKKAAPKE